METHEAYNIITLIYYVIVCMYMHVWCGEAACLWLKILLANNCNHMTWSFHASMLETHAEISYILANS